MVVDFALFFCYNSLMKKLFLAALVLLWIVPQVALAQTTTESGGVLGSDWDQHFEIQQEFYKPQDGSTSDEIKRLLLRNFLPLFKYVFGFIALLFWSLYVFTIITGGANEELITQNRDNLLFGVLGFALIALAVEVGQVVDPAQNPTEIINLQGFNDTTQKVIAYLQMIAGVVAMGAVFYAGFRFITASGNDEQINSAKSIFIWGFVGLVVMMIVPPIVNTVFYPAPDGQLGNEQIGNLAIQVTGFARFALMFLGVLAFTSFIIAGAYYVTSLGDDERQTTAKNIMLGTALGIIVILMSYTLIATLVPS